MKTLAEVGEDALVQQLTQKLHLSADVLQGPGDDCAIVNPAEGKNQVLLKTDVIVEGVHFTPDTPAPSVGRKALARAISDIAAMGGTPKYALITLIAPSQTPLARVTGIYRGLQALAKNYGVSIVGGETSSGQQLIINVALTGEVQAGKAVLRSGARSGDLIGVTGRLGGSLAGKHLHFQPRLKEAHWLLKHGHVHSMMDISDGVARDLPRLAQASGVGYHLWLDQVPRTRGCTAQQALEDGEDYELLFTLPENHAENLQKAWKRQFPRLKLSWIGQITPKARGQAAQPGGWEHFQS